MIPDFKLINFGKYEKLFEEQHIDSFHKLIAFLQNLPYGRTSNRGDFSLMFQEKKGTCSSKHGLLMEVCELHDIQDVELIVGIFLMSGSYHPKVETVLNAYDLKVIPEAHCYLRYDGKRYDFTSKNSKASDFESSLVREQRCDSIQVDDWKPMIHKHYIGGWLKRNQLPYSEEEIWKIREQCIASLSKN